MSVSRGYVGAAILTIILGVMFIFSAVRAEVFSQQARLRVLKAKVARLEAKAEAARDAVRKATDECEPDKLYELSRHAGWLTPEECADLSLMIAEINHLEGHDLPDAP